MKSSDKERHLRRFNGLKKIRQFFDEHGFLETPTPPMVENPGMETHIHPFMAKSINPHLNSESFLHTSPEFAMKELLSLGFEKIYNISYCFRDEPYSETHRPQFLMLEWYRSGNHYTEIMGDVENLIRHFEPQVDIRRATVQQLFQEFLGIDILELDHKEKLQTWIEDNLSRLNIGKQDFQSFSWDDLFFVLWLNEIEPQLKKYPALIVSEYPASMAALSTLKDKDPRVCERFELYLHGIEIANCFNELTDLDEQRARFKRQAEEKRSLYSYQLPSPNKFYQSLEAGLPKSAGIALGIERILGAIEKSDIPFWD